MTPKERRGAALRAMADHEVSQDRTCRLVGVDAKTIRRDRRPDDADRRVAMREIAGGKRRFRYRQIGILLERESMTMEHKKLHHPSREEGLSAKRRRERKRARGIRSAMLLATPPNARRSQGFLSDTFGGPRRIRFLAVNDDCCRDDLCLAPDTSISEAWVTRKLQAPARVYSRSKSIVSDNGTGFISIAIIGGADRNGMTCTTSTRAGRSKTASSEPSTAVCATSC